MKFTPRDKVVDLTARANDWTDVYGVVFVVDGSNVYVEYDSGNRRWKMDKSLRHRKEQPKDI